MCYSINITNDAFPFSKRVVAAHPSPDNKSPFLTVAIPHYKHRTYLEIVLQSIFVQTFDDFEIVISDDCSPDDSNQVIPGLLQKSGCAFRYYAQPVNLGYDGNVRFCLSAATGRYIFLLGNDDALTSPNTLQEIADQLRHLNHPDVAFTNFSDWTSHSIVQRAQTSQCLGSGPQVALRFFRSFSFVSGLIYKRSEAQRHETDRWDQSVFYQIYLASRIIGAGGTLAALNIDAVRKDIRIQGQTVPNYAAKWSTAKWSFQPRHTGLDSVIRVTADAILPLLPVQKRSAALRHIIHQVYTITYPYWLLEYRRVANWSFSVGVARDLWPGKLLAEYQLSRLDYYYLWLLYIMVTIASLTTPQSLFTHLKVRLANFIRHRQQMVSPTP